MSGIKEAFPATDGTNKRKRPLANESSENVDDYDDVDIYDDMPEVGLDAVLGADVNVFLLQFYANDESDPDLPSVNYRFPANWEPNIKSMNFLKIASDSEWKKEERLKIVEQFHPKDEYEGYFSPCKMPSKLYKTLKSPAAKKD